MQLVQAEEVRERRRGNDAVGRREPVLTLLVTAFDRANRPIVVVDVVIPPSRLDLEDVFPIG